VIISVCGAVPVAASEENTIMYAAACRRLMQLNSAMLI
jgi:hypothetical protein